MRPWQSGTFDRERISPVWHPFLPTQAIDSIHSIDLQVLHETGKRLLLLDVDNTLVVWQSEDLSEEVYHWIQEAKRLGFLVCILSNTNRVERLQRICSHLGVDYIRGRMKPSRVMYRLALVKYQVHANQAIMVGDQLMTDVLGANRSGIDAIWVRQMGGHEFGPTKINRFIESQLTSRIYKALVLPENESVRGCSQFDRPTDFALRGGGSEFVFNQHAVHRAVDARDPCWWGADGSRVRVLASGAVPFDISR